MENIDFEKRMMIPNKVPNETKHTYVTFYNEEAEKALQKYLATRNENTTELFNIKRRGVNKMLKRMNKKLVYILHQNDQEIGSATN